MKIIGLLFLNLALVSSSVQIHNDTKDNSCKVELYSNGNKLDTAHSFSYEAGDLTQVIVDWIR